MLIFSVLGSVNVFGQDERPISGEFDQISFDEFVAYIEDKTDYHFYYDPVWTDSLVADFNVERKSIHAVLNQLFAGTDLNYAVEGSGIYITRGRKIMVDLPPGFFEHNERESRAVATFDFSDYERREKEQKLAEAKLYNVGPRSSNMQGNATVAGNVRNAISGEPVIGAVVYDESLMIGASTDQFGYYALTLPKGKHEIRIKSVGMKATRRSIMLYDNGRLDIELDEEITPLKEVVIESDKDIRVTGLQMGVERLDIKTMKQIPLALGETDIMKVVLTLPGVQSVGEGTVGLNVRGGATNQNLILLNDAVVYNPSHLFGFFSTFNPDVLSNVELYKSGINAEYGGRLSSVLDVHTREGNTKEFTGSGGISPITGRLTFEGPLVKDKTSFIVGGRSTYSDWLLDRLNSKELKNSSGSFYDVTAQLTHVIDEDNSLYLSAYMSKDKFSLNSDTLYGYSDRNASLKWKKVFNNKLYGVLTGGMSEYEYEILNENVPVNAFEMDFRIRQVNAKADLSYFYNSQHTINFGVGTIRYELSPGDLKPKGEESLIIHERIGSEYGLESAIYLSETFDVNPDLSLYFGLRYSFYQNLGPRQIFQYAPGLAREINNIVDTVNYAKGERIANYSGAEPRFSIRYSLGENSSVKFSYNRMRQYIQMLSNTTAITPTDTWKLSDSYIKPQTGDQYSMGFYRNFKGSVETSVEAYYKTMDNTIDYKGGAVLLLNHHLETDVLSAQGKAYGIEWMLKRTVGKLNGWITYTYSRSLLRTRTSFSSETINGGEYYPSNFDKPHAVNFIGNYKFSRRFNFSLNVIYSTGRPITLPIGQYDLGGASRLLYSDRNGYRIPDYFRTDISVNFEGNHKVRKLAHSSWTFAVYNLWGRANAYSIFFVSEGEKIQGYKLSIFARPIPTITYNFKF